MKFTVIIGLVVFLAIFNIVTCENKAAEETNTSQIEEATNQDQLIEELMDRLVADYDSDEEFDRSQRSVRPNSDFIYNLINAYFERIRDSRGGLSKLRKFWKRNYRHRQNKMFWK